MPEHDPGGPATALRESLNGPAFERVNGAVCFVDVGNELLHKNVFAGSIFKLGVIVPAHRAAIREDIDGRFDVLVLDGLVNQLSQLNGLEFAAWTSTSTKVSN